MTESNRTTAAPDLLPCPFCENETVHVQDSYYFGNGFMVMCGNCTAEGPLCNKEGEAAAAWNLRAAPVQPHSGNSATTPAGNAGREVVTLTKEEAARELDADIPDSQMRDAELRAYLAAEPNACWDKVRDRPAQEWANERWIGWQARAAKANKQNIA